MTLAATASAPPRYDIDGFLARHRRRAGRDGHDHRCAGARATSSGTARSSTSSLHGKSADVDRDAARRGRRGARGARLRAPPHPAHAARRRHRQLRPGRAARRRRAARPHRPDRDRVAQARRSCASSAGAKMHDIDAATPAARAGSCACIPRPSASATIGGFVAGGSGGVGSIDLRRPARARQHPRGARRHAGGGAAHHRVARRRRAEGQPRLWHDRHHHGARNAAGAGLAVDRRRSSPSTISSRRCASAMRSRSPTASSRSSSTPIDLADPAAISARCKPHCPDGKQRR